MRKIAYGIVPFLNSDDRLFDMLLRLTFMFLTPSRIILDL
jgi:hypothetical protein